MSRTLSRYNRVKREEETKSYKEIRNIVLEILKDGNPHSLGDLERKVGKAERKQY